MGLMDRSEIPPDQITEILFDMQVDMSRLLPKLRARLNKPLGKAKMGQARETRFHMWLALLKKDFNDSAVWNCLDQTMAKLGKTIPIMCTETALIQLLAPHSPKARDLLNRYPRANHVLHPEYPAYARALLRKYGLPPTKHNASQNP